MISASMKKSNRSSYFVNPLVSNIEKYKPGRSFVVTDNGPTSCVIKLSSNENPMGMNPGVIESVYQSMFDVSRYPDDTAGQLRGKIAELNDITESQVVVGSGSSEILELLIRSFSGAGRNIVCPKYSFSIYKLFADSFGVAFKEAESPNYKLSVDKVLEKVDSMTSMVILANPNNPTGDFLSIVELRRLVASLPREVILVVDEAYCEYMDDENYFSALELMNDYPNVVVTRTFSKIHGLASMRIGYSLSSGEVADLIRKFKKPFNVSTQAMVAAHASLCDPRYIEASKELNSQGLIYLKSELEKIDISYLPSSANFITIKTGQYTDSLNAYLTDRGILVRTLAEYDMPDFLRVSVGRDHENERFIEIIRRFFG